MIFACMALRRTDVANAAVTVIEVVPVDETSRPDARLVEIGEALGGELWAVLGRAEQRLGISSERVFVGLIGTLLLKEHGY